MEGAGAGVFTLLGLVAAAVMAVASDSVQLKDYSNVWVAEILGGELAAKRVAVGFGYTYAGPIDEFENHYLLTREDHPQLSKRGSQQLTRSLLKSHEVKWAQQQTYIKRSKRGYIDQDASNILKVRRLSGGEELLSHEPPHGLSNTSWSPDQGDLSNLGKFSTKPSASSLATYHGVTKHVNLLSSKSSAYRDLFNDPLWPKQWYLQDYRTRDMPVMDLNVVPAYRLGYTGHGVTVAVVDDGLQGDHPDLADNYVDRLSFDFTQGHIGSQPESLMFHGTMCAGEIAMVANNHRCGVGVAFNANITGIKTVGERVNELGEARGLIHQLAHVDIYSSSWGPTDDGRTLEPVDRLTDLAFQKGVTRGRKGRGALYTFAGGNGRQSSDNCAADGLVNHVNIIGVAPASQTGRVTYYGERCTAILCTAYSSGASQEERVASSGVNEGCTTSFTGTSAAVPLATGILALVLQANSNLTYRDVMHIITMGAEVAPLADNDDTWYKNGKGFWVSNDFGFGLLNAENMVILAKNWKNVPNKSICTVAVQLKEPQRLTTGSVAEVSFHTDACQGSGGEAVHYLEHIELCSTIDYPHRGALSITIVSPAGTKSHILEPRLNDSSNRGLQGWKIKSVHNWGENPRGHWQIQVKANIVGVSWFHGYVRGFTLILHGTAVRPAHHDTLVPRKYSGFRLSSGITSEDM